MPESADPLVKVEYPRIFLALDNSFAVKRWTRPKDWLGKVAEIGGISLIEANTDVECDPSFSTARYLSEWTRQVKEEQVRHGLRVALVHSGHASYRTLGLGHQDADMRRKIQDEWLNRVIALGAELGAGVGAYIHAFDDSVLQDPAEYARMEAVLIDTLAEIVGETQKAGAPFFCLEQMYTPHQTPWTISGAADYLKRTYAKAGHPLYLTIDTGHQIGQRKFLRPGLREVESIVERRKNGGSLEGIWLGPDSAYRIIEEASGASTGSGVTDRIMAEIDRFPHLFSAPRDGDLYGWFRALGCYGLNVHLQQTDGRSSSHSPFTDAYNKKGIVEPRKLLEAIRESFDSAHEEGLPPPCREIYLTFEIFAGTAELPNDIIQKLRESVLYWRRYVPQDGLPLNQLT